MNHESIASWMQEDQMLDSLAYDLAFEEACLTWRTKDGREMLISEMTIEMTRRGLRRLPSAMWRPDPSADWMPEDRVIHYQGPIL